MVRGITRKQNIITMQGSFHGRTFGAMALTKSKTIYADGSAPLMVRPSPFRTCQPCLTRGCTTARRGDGPVSVLAPLQFGTGRGRGRARARVAVPIRAPTPPAECAVRHGRPHRRARAR